MWPMTTSPVVFVCCEPPAVGAGDLVSESLEFIKNLFKNTQRVAHSDVIIATVENT